MIFVPFVPRLRRNAEPTKKEEWWENMMCHVCLRDGCGKYAELIDESGTMKATGKNAPNTANYFFDGASWCKQCLDKFFSDIKKSNPCAV